MSTLRNQAGVIWAIADTLRGPYKRSEYGHVILPLTLMRRLDQAMEDTKDAVVAEGKLRRSQGIENVELLLRRVAGRSFFNESPLRFDQLPDDPRHIATNLRAYIDGYSEYAEAVFANFDFEKQIQKLETHDLLHAVVSAMCEVDLHPDRVSNLEMGYMFEELIRKFAESSNDEAGAHFTPREVVRLMVNLLVAGDEEALSGKAPIRTVYDCACGTGGMLSEAEAHIKALNENAVVHLFGQEINEQSYAICLADMLIRGQDPSRVIRDNTLTHDGHASEMFHYGIANPPFGTDWKAEYTAVKTEHETAGPDGRFAPGLPGRDDGQTLFLLQLLSKMRPLEDEHGQPIEGGGSRVAIVHNGSPLFSGGPGSGLSEIRRHVIENDLLETIVALPEQLFYNTGIASYIWVLTNRKAPERQGRVQLIDARDLWVRMRKSLGEKRREISAEQIDEITTLHATLSDCDRVKVLDNDFFAYRRVTVERPLRGRWQITADTWADAENDDGPLAKLDEHDRPAAAAALRAIPADTYDTEADVRAVLKDALLPLLGKVGAPLLRTLVAACFVRDPDADPLTDAKGRVLPDPELRDTETIPWTEDVADYLEREVLPWAPDAYVPDQEGKKGYEIPLTRLFHVPVTPRPSFEIKAEIGRLQADFRAAIDAVLA
ncbi:type I restriction-modification system subunit M [Conexibacter arvalis]|uniref:site-specific DNA-methyltransferase (adenine-specific) n=1 Tax=Conexibacter arvalis TaxID=912552 RepID=A0A840I8J3_9ACTN|nr:class I SAM-dependent DNA methyltransferase [Conexibacter arvalis]MBB4660474.1 type I restriction enzyme M protein [Conexibacter arvalis]